MSFQIAAAKVVRAATMMVLLQGRMGGPVAPDRRVWGAVQAKAPFLAATAVAAAVDMSAAVVAVAAELDSPSPMSSK